MFQRVPSTLHQHLQKNRKKERKKERERRWKFNHNQVQSNSATMDVLLALTAVTPELPTKFLKFFFCCFVAILLFISLIYRILEFIIQF